MVVEMVDWRSVANALPRGHMQRKFFASVHPLVAPGRDAEMMAARASSAIMRP
jgi:hypothetical protein